MNQAPPTKRIFSWDLPRAAGSACGVADSEFSAMSALGKALLDHGAVAGTSGTVRVVEFLIRESDYQYGPVVASGMVAADQAITWVRQPEHALGHAEACSGRQFDV